MIMVNDDNDNDNNNNNNYGNRDNRNNNDDHRKWRCRYLSCLREFCSKIGLKSVRTFPAYSNCSEPAMLTLLMPLTLSISRKVPSVMRVN